MRRLTASQRIAQLEHRIARLEKSSSRFDEFALDVVAEAAEDVALMVNARFSTKSFAFVKTREATLQLPLSI